MSETGAEFSHDESAREFHKEEKEIQRRKELELIESTRGQGFLARRRVKRGIRISRKTGADPKPMTLSESNQEKRIHGIGILNKPLPSFLDNTSPASRFKK